MVQVATRLSCGVRIVVVDDNEADRHIVATRLRQLFPDAPWTIDVLRNGTEALQHLRRHVGQRCLVLCDERMDALHGSDVLKALANEGLLEAVDFVLFSAHPMASYSTHLGATIMRKPDDLAGYDALLRQVVDAWFGHAQQDLAPPNQ